MSFSKSIGSYLILILVACTFSTYAQPTAHEINTAMSRGINLGNTLEPPQEGGWNNGTAKEYYFDDYKEAGFKCVRIPVRWDEHTSDTTPYSVDEDWMDRVEEVVDWGLERDLYIVLNTHHDDWIKGDYGNQLLRDRFDSIWSQIAIRFQNKPYRLLFEMINEPNGIALNDINELNARVLSIIRRTNPTRVVLFSGHRWSNSAELMAATILDDPYLIGYFHSYDPWDFAGLAVGTWGSTSDLNSLRSKFDAVQNWSESANIPVTLNEFGAARDCDYNSRMYHYASYVEEARKHNFSFNAWDDGGNFGIYQREQRDWNDIKDILINATITSPTKLKLATQQDSSLLLTWNTRSETLYSIIIERKTYDGDFTPIATLYNDARSYNDYDVEFGKDYYYRVVDQYEHSKDIPSYPITGFLDATKIKVGLNNIKLTDNFIIRSNKSNSVTIDNKSNLKGSISFYNLNGALLLKDMIEVEFNEYTLSENGIIIYHINSLNSVVKTGKVLVK